MLRPLLLYYMWFESFVPDFFTWSHVFKLSYRVVLLCGCLKDQAAIQSLTFSLAAWVWCRPDMLVSTKRSLVCTRPERSASRTRAGKGDDGGFTSKQHNANVDTLSLLLHFNVYLPYNWLFEANQVSKPTSRSCSFPLNFMDMLNGGFVGLFALART